MNLHNNIELFVSSIGRFAALLLNFGLYILIFRSISLNEFAEYSLINGIQSFILVVVSGPILNLIGKETWFWLKDKKLTINIFKYLQPLTVIYLTAFLLILILSFILGWLTFIGLFFYSIGVVCFSITSLFSALFNAVGILRNRYLFSLYMFVDGLFKILFVLGANNFLVLKQGAIYFFLIQLGSLIGVGILYFISKGRLIKLDLQFASDLLFNDNIFKKNTYLIFDSNKSLNTSAFFNWGTSTGNRYVVEPLVSKNLLGLYIAGFNLGNSILSAAEGFFTNFMLPLLYNKISIECVHANKKLICTKYLFLWLGYLMPLLFLFLYKSDEIISLILGDSRVSLKIVRFGLLYSFGLLFLGLSQSFSLIFSDYKSYLRATIINFILGIIGLFFITKFFDLEMGVLCLALSSILSVLYFINASINFFSINIFLIGVLKVLLVSFLLLVVSYFLFNNNFIDSFYFKFALCGFVWFISVYFVFKNWINDFRGIA